MSETWVKVLNKETKDVFFLLKGAKSKFIEGEEYVLVKRTEYDKTPHFCKRSSLQIHWR